MKKLQINNIIKITAFTLLIFTLTFSCKNEDECEYTIVQLTIPEGCDVVSKLNLSTGIDVNGNTLPVPVTRTDGLIDPFWKLLNTPIASSCSFAADGNAYTVNIGSNGPDAWINQTGATSLSPFNAGDSRPGDCANPKNSDGSNIAYVFERSFCILKNTNVNLNFTFKADNVIYFQLVDNLTSSIIDTSSTYTYSAVPSIWNTSGINLIAGSYSIRAYLVNNESFIGFSLLGNIESASGDLSFV